MKVVYHMKVLLAVPQYSISGETCAWKNLSVSCMDCVVKLSSRAYQS